MPCYIAVTYRPAVLTVKVFVMTIRFARALGVVVTICFALASQIATAAEQGFYVGGYYGQSDKDTDRGEVQEFALFVYDAYGFQPVQSNSSFDTKDSGYGFFGGYRLFTHFAIEGGYMDLGEVAFRDQSSGIDLTNDQPGNWNQKITIGSSGISLSALGILPLSYRSEIFGRAGVLFSTNELQINISDGVGSDNPEFSESDTDWLIGVGAGFTFAEIYTLRLEYQRVLDAGDESMGEADLDLLSLGVTVAF